MEGALELELLLTDAFLVLGSHLLHGRVDPVTIHPEWTAVRREADLAHVLERGLGESRTGAAMATVLDGLRPRQPEYGALRDALRHLRSVAGADGWGALSGGPTLKPGARDDRVPALRRRIRAGGDPAPAPAAGDSLLYDPELAEGVRRFQRRHGLTDDGEVGQRTLAALNVPVEQRVQQVEIALERWRWLPDTLGRRHVRVNIAAFQTRVFEDGREVMELRSIVGRQYRETPVFSARMTYLVLSPYWHLPPTIAAVDKLPEIRKDPGYVAAQRMTLFEVATGAVVDPNTVDWSTVTGPEFNRRFRLRQEPGPSNALGDVKFMFPNRWNVYLHDTPSRELFARDERSFSSGCIRVEQPLELAAHLLRGDPSWTPERIRSVVEAGVERSVTLAEPVPVHILYLTAFVDEEGLVNFRSDIYGRDVPVASALAESPPREP